MTYCYSKDPIACIKYTGDNSEEVCDFCYNHAASYLCFNGQVLAPVGTWFVYEAEYSDVFRYTEEGYDKLIKGEI